MELSSSHDKNAVARTICHEEVISLAEEETVTDKVTEVESSSWEPLSFPEPWTFDDLYEELDEHLGFYV